jgi:hypothetical protein
MQWGRAAAGMEAVGLCQTLNATVSKVDNLIWLPRARKNKNCSRGPTVGEFCAGTCAYRPRLYGDPGPTKVLPGPTVTFFFGDGCTKSRGPTDAQGPKDDLRPSQNPLYITLACAVTTSHPDPPHGRDDEEGAIWFSIDLRLPNTPLSACVDRP